MRRQLILASLLIALAVPQALADNVTVHGTQGMLEAQLIDKYTGELSGTVEIWNKAMDLNIVVSPPSGCLLRKVYVYLDTEPPPPPIPEWYEDTLNEYMAEFRELGPLLRENPDLWPQYQALLVAFGELWAEYQQLIVVQDFGEWPYGAAYEPPTAAPYSLTVHLSEMAGLQWGLPWAAHMLPRRATRRSPAQQLIVGTLPTSTAKLTLLRCLS